MRPQVDSGPLRYESLDDGDHMPAVLMLVSIASAALTAWQLKSLSSAGAR